MGYRTKAERRQRKELLFTLAREQAKFVKAMAGMQEYSGRAYSHEVDELREITARIAAEYLKGASDD